MKIQFKHIFFLINILLSIYYFDSWANGNTTSRVLPAVSFIQNGTIHFEEIDSLTHDKSIIDGKHYSDKAPLPTLLFIPIATALEYFNIVDISNGDFGGLYAWAGFIFATIPFILLMLLTYQRARSFLSDKFDILYLLLPWYGSFIFAYSASMYSHVFAGFLLVLAFISIEKKHFILAGFLIGAVFVTEYPLAIVGMIWGLQIWYKNGFKKAFYFALGVIPLLILLGYYNYAITGNPFTLLYKYVDPNYAFMHDAYGMELPSLKVMFQILFGQYKGLLFYCPVFVIILYFGLKNWSVQQNKLATLLLDPVGLPFIAGVILISSYAMWWGGWAFGARHMIALTILLLFKYLPILASANIKKWIGYPILFLGAAIGLLAKTTAIYSIPTEVDYPLPFLFKNAFSHHLFNPNNLLVQFFKFDIEISTLVYTIFFVFCIVLLYTLQPNKKR